MQTPYEPPRAVPRHELCRREGRHGARRHAFPRQALTVCSELVEAIERALPKYLFFALFALLVAVVVLSLGAHAAFAQEEGAPVQAVPTGQDGGDAIGQTLANVRNYLAGLSFAVGGIGFVASLLVKGYASINENAHAYAAMGMKGSLWCIVAGVIVTPILSIAAGLAGGGGGGG